LWQLREYSRAAFLGNNQVEFSAMPNGDGGNLKVNAIFNLHDVPHEQWHIVTARHLRAIADEIEADGLKLPGPRGRVTNHSDDGKSRAIFEYSVR
jgi:hypothetical protein